MRSTGTRTLYGRPDTDDMFVGRSLAQSAASSWRSGEPMSRRPWLLLLPLHAWTVSGRVVARGISMRWASSTRASAAPVPDKRQQLTDLDLSTADARLGACHGPLLRPVRHTVLCNAAVELAF